jgi:hypothetical protein
MELSIQLPILQWYVAHIYRHTVLQPLASSVQFLGIAPTRPLVSFGPWLLFGPWYLQYLGPRFGTCVQYHIATVPLHNTYKIVQLKYQYNQKY